jgi:hypothetical protein
MKQEFVNIAQLVEQKYGFDRCEKTEFVKQITKEFTKYEKKLAKIENYQKMREEGKPLSKEILEIIEKKQSFIDHIASLRNVTDVYVKTSSNHTEAVLKAIQEQVKMEVGKKEKEFREEELQKLSNFFVVAAMFKEKDHISPTPLFKVPKEKQEAIMKKYIELTKLTHNKDTTMREEAKKLREGLIELLKDEEMKSHVESVMKNDLMADAKFKISEGPEYEFVMLQSADRLEMSEQIKPETKTQVAIRPNSVLPHPEPKKEETKEMGSVEVLNLEKSEKAIEDDRVAPSLIDASQESEFEIAISKSTKRRLRQEEINCDEARSRNIDEIDEEENDKKFLNHHNAFKQHGMI